MSLRKRAALFSGFAMLVSFVVLYLASQLILLKSYEQIEEQDTIENLQRVTNALQNQLQSLKKIAWGYVQWNDTRDFILKGDTDYIENNFADSMYSGIGIDV